MAIFASRLAFFFFCLGDVSRFRLVLLGALRKISFGSYSYSCSVSCSSDSFKVEADSLSVSSVTFCFCSGGVPVSLPACVTPAAAVSVSVVFGGGVSGGVGGSVFVALLRGGCSVLGGVVVGCSVMLGGLGVMGASVGWEGASVSMARAVSVGVGFF